MTIVNNAGGEMSQFIDMFHREIVAAAHGAELPDELADLVTVTVIDDAKVLVEWA